MAALVVVHRLASVLDNDQLAFKEIHELVLMRVPMALARPTSRRQARHVDAEVGKPATETEPLPHAAHAWHVEGSAI
jgi:hypothetical protein